ncbi:arylcarboxylate reductase [Peterkaempfera bronchialis]|uniref:arylcarboxylate reductase n=1 Tax=Peterkaempfera bronchialis TaxID=2126346 RepID=UPI003C2ADE1F
MAITGSPDALLSGQWLERQSATDLDTWTRQVVRRHFDPVSGSPFWLKRRGALGFDPFDITRYGELRAFGDLMPEVLREVDPVDLVPQGASGPPTGCVFESEGTMGRPCRVFLTEAMSAHRAAWRGAGLAAAGFRSGRTWVHATPGGPHPVGLGAAQVARSQESVVYRIDLDPRWIRRLIGAGRLAEVNRYVDHLTGQITDILSSTGVDYLETTPALFQALLRRRPELVAGLSGVWLSGTQILPAMYREFADALGGGLIGTAYENTFGGATGLPAEDGGDVLPYVPHYPQVTMDVVDRGDPSRTVEYGEVGRVRLTVLHEDLFLPGVLERDQAVRHRLPAGPPCDGVANIQPLQATWAVPEGIY